MPRYRVFGQVTVSCYTDVTADDPAEALRAANGRSDVVLASSGDASREGWDPTEVWVVEDADGQPQSTHVEIPERDDGEEEEDD
jgi:hypothetical protein